MSACSWFPMKREGIQAWVEAHRDAPIGFILMSCSRPMLHIRRAESSAITPIMKATGSPIWNAATPSTCATTLRGNSAHG